MDPPVSDPRGNKTFIRRHCRTGTPGRAARHMSGIPRIFCHLPRRSLRRASHGKLIHVGLPENNDACLFEFFYRTGIIGWVKTA